MAILQVNFPPPPPADVGGFATTVTGWNVYVNGDSVPIAENVPVSWGHRGFEVPDDGTYYAQVAAINAQGVGPKSDRSNTVSLSTPVLAEPTKPGAPSLSLIRMMGGGGSVGGGVNLVNGDPITITKEQLSVAGFGTRAQPEPAIWDDFRGGGFGQILAGTSPAVGLGSYINALGTIDADSGSVGFRNPRTYPFADLSLTPRTTFSSKCATLYFGDRFGAGMSELPGAIDPFTWAQRVKTNKLIPWLPSAASRMYFSYWRYCTFSSDYSGVASGWRNAANCKYVQLNADSTDGSFKCRYGMNGGSANNTNVNQALENGVGGVNVYNTQLGMPQTEGCWVRTEMYADLSGPGAPYLLAEHVVSASDQPGARAAYLPLFPSLTRKAGSETEFADQFVGTGSSVLQRSTPFFFIDQRQDDGGGPVSQPNWDFRVYIDELTLDDSPARVEIGDAATYDSCIWREYQPATSWADGEITFTFNKGMLSDSLYLYVIKDEGVGNLPTVVNRNSGYQLAA